MALRVVRASAEVLGTAASGQANVTRALAEVAGQTNPDLRLYRFAMQILQGPGPIEETVSQSLIFGQVVTPQIGFLRVVRASAEVLGTPASGQANVTRVLAEVAGTLNPDLRLYRFAYQALVDRSVKGVSQSLIFGQTAKPTLGNLRVTRVAIDVLGTVDSELRVTRTHIDVYGEPDDPDLRLHRMALQVLIEDIGAVPIRVTRVATDVFGTPDDPDLRLHRMALQVLVNYESVTPEPYVRKFRTTTRRTMRQLPRRRS